MRAKLTKEFHPHDFHDPLDGLSDDLVNEDVYDEAAQAGIDAVGTDITKPASSVSKVWVGHVRKYAKQVPGRISEALAEAANSPAEPSDVDAVLARIDAKLESLRSSITRYAEPPWGAGNQGYGAGLEESGVMLVWELGDPVTDHCDDCPDLAANSPYERGAIPTWPKLGDTQCMDRCYCSIVADPETWNAAFPNEE